LIFHHRRRTRDTGIPLLRAVGTNLYTVSRILERTGRGGIVNGGRQHLVLCDPHALVKVAEEE
jgi:hypothetical protein